MRYILFILISLAVSSMYAEPILESASVSSASADYDGNALILRGQVLLDHGLGKMRADEAALERQETGKDFPFAMIHLKKEVLLTLKNEAELRCDMADLDFTTLKGVLFAKDDGKVVYTDMLKRKGSEKVALRMLSQALELEMSKLGYDGKKTDYDIETILAKEDVVVDYANAFTLRADHAIYRKPQDHTLGMITAYPKDENSKCRLTHEGDIVDANTVNLDLAQSCLLLDHPVGVLLSSLVPHLQKGQIRFQAEQMVWDHNQNTLTLKGQVYVDESALGLITSDDEVRIVHARQKGKRVLKSLHSYGMTTLDYKDTGDGARKLVCYGALNIDREHLTANIESLEVDGVTPTDKQIYYEEAQVAIYSDKAAFEYSIVDNALQPVSMALKGNVRLFSRDQSKPPRCGLADRLNYSPTTHTLIMAANPGKKVLFYDEEQALRISANEIHVTHDPSTKKETVKGIGNVQFAFSSEENQILKQFFPSTVGMSNE